MKDKTITLIVNEQPVEIPVDRGDRLHPPGMREQPKV